MERREGREIDAAKARSRTSSIIDKGRKSKEVRAIVVSRGRVPPEERWGISARQLFEVYP